MSIIEKIKALLDKTENQGCTPEEAASAAKVAQQLITQYKLNIADIKEISGDIKRHPPLYCAKEIPSWLNDLGFWICKLNGCIMYQANYKDNTKGLGIIGRKSDVRFVRFIFNHCQREIERLLEENKPKPDSSFTKLDEKEWSNSFKHGAVNQIASRMREVHSCVLDSHYNETAIIRLQDADHEVNEWAQKNLSLRPVKQERGRGFNATGYTAGFQAGSRINVGRQLSGTNKVDNASLSD